MEENYDEIDTLNKRMALVESVLFLESNPLRKSEVMEITSLDEEVLAKALAGLKEKYTEKSSGLTLFEENDTVRLVPKKEVWEAMEKKAKKKPSINKTIVETLSIIAWSQPISLEEINNIRHKKSGSQVQKLMEDGLIEQVENSGEGQSMFLYKTTEYFLKCFHLESIKDLPKIQEGQKIILNLSR